MTPAWAGAGLAIGLVLILEIFALLARNTRLAYRAELDRDELARERRNHADTTRAWQESEHKASRWEEYARRAEDELNQVRRAHIDQARQQLQQPAGAGGLGLFNELGQLRAARADDEAT